MTNIEQLIHLAQQYQATDLHLVANSLPWVRINGDLQLLNQNHVVSKEALDTWLLSYLPPYQIQFFKKGQECDFTMDINTIGRIRVHIYRKKGKIAAALRLLPKTIPTIEDLAIPETLLPLLEKKQGLILVTGPTGSGKSTTLAAMFNYLNCNFSRHLVTIEDPIEFIYINNKSLISQREVLSDTKNFHCALRSVLRQDPDVILIGEMRDLITIRLALTAAETGHLVLASLHTPTAAQTINRIIDAFPSVEKTSVSSLLASSLTAVLAQKLLKKKHGGQLAAFELLLNTPAVENLIRENKLAQIYSLMQTSSFHGMQTFERHILELTKKNLL